jgi:hypothetical protein
MPNTIQTQITDRFAELQAQAEGYLTRLEAQPTPKKPKSTPVTSPNWLDTGDLNTKSGRLEKASILDFIKGDVKFKSSRSRGGKE